MDLKPLNLHTRDELYKAYKDVLTDLDGGGTYDPQASALRAEWDRRGWDLRPLHLIDRRFKTLKRKNPEKSKDSS